MFGAPRRTLLFVMTIALLLGAAGSVWGVLTGPAGQKTFPHTGSGFATMAAVLCPTSALCRRKIIPGGMRLSWRERPSQP